MYGLYMHWPPSTFACKCGVHRIFIILSWIDNPMQEAQVWIPTWIKWSVGRVHVAHFWGEFIPSKQCTNPCCLLTSFCMLCLYPTDTGFPRRTGGSNCAHCSESWPSMRVHTRWRVSLDKQRKLIKEISSLHKEWKVILATQDRGITGRQLDLN